MNGESRRSREAVRNSIRSYGVKVMDPASLPLKNARRTESQESVGRFSERSLHSHYKMQQGGCRSCLTRIPYATLLATVVTLLGILIFAVSIERCAVLTNNMISNLLKRESKVVSSSNSLFLFFEIMTIIASIMILVIGILATGDTRARVYAAWKARIGGRVTCAILMLITLVLLVLWLGTLYYLAILSFIVYVGNDQCEFILEKMDSQSCLHLPMLDVFFPNSKEGVKICGMQEVKNFCKDYVEKVSISYITSNFAVAIIIVGLVLFLICLSANYARIRCQAKFQELEEMRHLNAEHHQNTNRF